MLFCSSRGALTRRLFQDLILLLVCRFVKILQRVSEIVSKLPIAIVILNFFKVSHFSEFSWQYILTTLAVCLRVRLLFHAKFRILFKNYEIY